VLVREKSKGTKNVVRPLLSFGNADRRIHAVKRAASIIFKDIRNEQAFPHSSGRERRIVSMKRRNLERRLFQRWDVFSAVTMERG